MKIRYEIRRTKDRKLLATCDKKTLGKTMDRLRKDTKLNVSGNGAFTLHLLVSK